MAGASRRSSQTTFVISVAAELAGMHPQTLRQYDRLGLVTPERTKGRGRRYTQRHVDLLREVQRLSQDEGINLAGIQRILDLQNQVEAMRVERDRLLARLHELEDRRDRVFAADASGQVHQYRRGQRPHSTPLATPTPVGDGVDGQMVVWSPWQHPRVPQRASIEAPRRGQATRAQQAGTPQARSQRAPRTQGNDAAQHTIIEMDGTTIRIINTPTN